MIKHNGPPEPEEFVLVTYGKKELLTRVEFERRIREGELPIDPIDGTYETIRK